MPKQKRSYAEKETVRIDIRREYLSKVKALEYLTGRDKRERAIEVGIDIAVHLLEETPEESRPAIVNGIR